MTCICVFELPHIFIVFPPGTGGNFLAGLISKLINLDQSELHVSNNGSSHTSIDRKVAGTDYMSFGTVYDDQLSFASPEQRLTYYLKNIEKLDGEITTPQVVWSHDFTNIPLYKNFFPNSKILVITQNSDIEKLVAVCMNVVKNWMDPNHVAPFPPEQWAKLNDILDTILEHSLRPIVGEKSKEVVKNKFTGDNYNLVKFIRIRNLLSYFGLLHLVDKNSPPTKDVTNVVLFRTPFEEFIKNMKGPSYKTGLPCESYYTQDSVLLPYSYLIEGRANLLVDAIESTVGKLTDSQRIYIAVQFNKYRDMQDQVMLTDPYKYFSDLKNTVFKK